MLVSSFMNSYLVLILDNHEVLLFVNRRGKCVFVSDSSLMDMGLFCS